MGEQVYDAEGMQIQFSDNDEEWWCLCADLPGDEWADLAPEEIRSLALLGAAVRLAHDNRLPHGILPEAVPEWIRNEIKRLIPKTADEPARREPERRRCNDCGEEWADRGDETCTFCQSVDTELIEE